MYREHDKNYITYSIEGNIFKEIIFMSSLYFLNSTLNAGQRKVRI